RVPVAFRELVAEPQRDPGTVRLLRPGKKNEGAARRSTDAIAKRLGQRVEPGAPGHQRVSCEVGTAAVERQLAPAPAEGGDAAVGVLKIGEPGNAGNGRLASGLGLRSEVVKR